VSIIEHEPGATTTLPYEQGGKIRNVPVDAYVKVADLATAGTSMAATETIDGAFYGTFEQLAADIRPIPIVGPILAAAFLKIAYRVKKGLKAPASRQQNQAQAHAAKALHAVAVVVDATAFWIGDFAEATYNALAHLTHVTLPQYVEQQVKPVRITAANALKLAKQDAAQIAAGLAAINSLASSLPWDFNAATFGAGMRVWVGLFTRLWHKVYLNLERRLAQLETVVIPALQLKLGKLDKLVRGAVIPDITKLKQQMSNVLLKVVPALKVGIAKVTNTVDNVVIPQVKALQVEDVKQNTQIGTIITELAPLIGLGTAAGFGLAFGNAAANDPLADTNICNPATECVGSHVLSKSGWSWLKKLLPAILAGAIDALLLADMCLICKAAQTLVTVVEPELRGIAYLEGRLVDSGCGSLPPPMPAPAYS
jgi:hypothetical protein